MFFAGAPTELSPAKDDPALGSDPERNNKFDFRGTEGSGQNFCPFASHIRKMVSDWVTYVL
jgi:hypothetical protein